jgi:hypothetical protein
MRRARGRDGGNVTCDAGETRIDNSKSEIQGFFPFDKLRARMTTPLRCASVGMTSSMRVP